MMMVIVQDCSGVCTRLKKMLSPSLQLPHCHIIIFQKGKREQKDMPLPSHSFTLFNSPTLRRRGRRRLHGSSTHSLKSSHITKPTLIFFSCTVEELEDMLCRQRDSISNNMTVCIVVVVVVQYVVSAEHTMKKSRTSTIFFFWCSLLFCMSVER